MTIREVLLIIDSRNSNMSFLDNGKKIVALEKELAETVANFGTASALAESRLSELSALAEKFSALEKSAAASVDKISAELTAAQVALTAEQKAHEATKASVDAQAAIKAQTILAQAGQPPEFQARPGRKAPMLPPT